MLKETRIYSLAQVGGQVVLVLEEVEGPRLLPIWIGLYEGGSIGMALAGQKFPRPLTHDLLLNMLEKLGVDVKKIVITELKDSTFFAEIHLQKGETGIVMDARPSDSIAIAVRERCPIFVEEGVFEACPELLKPISEEEVDDFKKKLETMTPEDFFRDLKEKGKEGPGEEKGEEDKE
ncbi:MAG: bifunctional nuclease family protein [Elusimicrobia bacterium]|nr:bifunctional nuclease family protein [Elusimicrobiota bacterium]